MVRLTSFLAALALALVPSGALAAEEWFTLDGERVSQAVAEEAGNAGAGCAAGAAPTGEIACFSTQELKNERIEGDLTAGELPPGFASLPSANASAADDAEIGTDAAEYQQMLSSLANARVSGCGYPDAHVFTGAGNTGNWGWFYYTGWDTWVNHTSTYNNTISSYWDGEIYTARWHDYSNGSGPYYGYSYPCRDVYNLANGSWDNRFTSYARW